MIKMVLSFLVFGVFSMSTLAQYNSQFNNSSTNNTSEQNSSIEVLVDSDMNLEETFKGKIIPASVRSSLTLVTIYYYSFDDKLHCGQLVVNKEIADDVVEIFKIIREIKFPVEKVIPINSYKWSDSESMKDNNTSCFNYRFISGSKILSKHASGLAIDINPMQNPYIKNNKTSPTGAIYDTNVKGTITSDSRIVAEFKKRGWTWGGDWKSLKDYQHFQKEISENE